MVMDTVGQVIEIACLDGGRLPVDAEMTGGLPFGLLAALARLLG